MNVQKRIEQLNCFAGFSLGWTVAAAVALTASLAGMGGAVILVGLAMQLLAIFLAKRLDWSTRHP